LILAKFEWVVIIPVRSRRVWYLFPKGGARCTSKRRPGSTGQQNIVAGSLECSSAQWSGIQLGGDVAHVSQHDELYIILSQKTRQREGVERTDC